MSFESIADRRLLSTARSRLGELTWDVEADGDLRRSVRSDVPFDYLMQLMARRGLDPSLVTILLDRLPPLERAFVAWDVARGSLIGRDELLAQRVATAITPLKQLGPLATVAVPRDRVTSLIEVVTATSGDTSEVPTLAGVVSLERGADLDTVIAHAKQLACAHLPSLALAFLQIAWERVASQPAFDLMIEVAVDTDMLDAPPIMNETDDRSVVQQAYVLLRTCSRQYDFINGQKYLEALSNHAAVATSTDPAFLLAKAELALLSNRRADDDATRTVLATAGRYQAGRAAAAWRYGVFVNQAIAMRYDSANPASRAAEFTWTFGNDARLWGHAAFEDKHRAAVLLELSRELRYASHDPNAWRAVALLVPDSELIDAQIDERLGSQLAAAFA